MNAVWKASTISLLVFLVTILTGFLSTALAQAPILIACGESIESVFTEDRQTHQYIMNAQTGMSLILYAEVKIGTYERLQIDIGLRAPNNFEIDPLYGSSATSTVVTDWLSVDGRYEISVRGLTDTGGAYLLTANCLHEDGTVVSATNMVQSLQCGSIVENTITIDQQIHHYYIVLSRNDQVKLFASSLVGSYETLRIDIGLWSPNGFEIDPLYGSSQTSNIETAPLSTPGIYRLLLRGQTSTSGGYELAVTCTLADGTVINPGDVPPVNLSIPVTEMPSASVEKTFTGFGFPGLAPVDFINVARLPIPAGIPMSGAVTPTGSEILGYQFDAEAGDIVELSFSRLSGNLNLGLVVIDSESNVIYQASLVTTESMTARFTVPTAGQYTAGIFRISLLPPSAPEPTAFQVIATVNP